MRRLQRLQRQVTLQLPHSPLTVSLHPLSLSFSLTISPSLSLYVSPSRPLFLTLTLLFFMCVHRTHKIIARRRVQPIGVRVSTAAQPLCVCVHVLAYVCMCMWRVCVCFCVLVPNCMSSFVLRHSSTRHALRLKGGSPRPCRAHNSWLTPLSPPPPSPPSLPPRCCLATRKL